MIKNTLQGTIKESIKHFKYKILKSYMYNKSIMSYKKLNSLNKWGDNPCLQKTTILGTGNQAGELAQSLKARLTSKTRNRKSP